MPLIDCFLQTEKRKLLSRLTCFNFAIVRSVDSASSKASKASGASWVKSEVSFVDNIWSRQVSKTNWCLMSVCVVRSCLTGHGSANAGVNANAYLYRKQKCVDDEKHCDFGFRRSIKLRFHFASLSSSLSQIRHLIALIFPILVPHAPYFPQGHIKPQHKYRLLIW